jgi:hypothetical protein
MLAEVRKYGEGLLIVDQIPSKLTPEILKNTNTKIVHRIFARDDKEAIGNTIALKDEQKDFLSSLETGRAIVFTQSWPKAVQLQIEKEGGSDPQSSSRPAPAVGSQEACVGAEEVGEDRLRSAILDFYRHSYRRGILTGLQDWPTMPEAADTETCLQFLQEEALSRLYPGAWADSKGIKRLRTEILRLEALFGQGAFVAGFILRKFFREEESLSLATRRAYLEAFLEKCRQEEVSDRTLFSDYDDRLRP